MSHWNNFSNQKQIMPQISLHNENVLANNFPVTSPQEPNELPGH